MSQKNNASSSEYYKRLELELNEEERTSFLLSPLQEEDQQNTAQFWTSEHYRLRRKTMTIGYKGLKKEDILQSKAFSLGKYLKNIEKIIEENDFVYVLLKDFYITINTPEIFIINNVVPVEVNASKVIQKGRFFHDMISARINKISSQKDKNFSSNNSKSNSSSHDKSVYKDPNGEMFEENRKLKIEVLRLKAQLELKEKLLHSALKRKEPVKAIETKDSKKKKYVSTQFVEEENKRDQQSNRNFIVDTQVVKEMERELQQSAEKNVKYKKTYNKFNFDEKGNPIDKEKNATIQRRSDVFMEKTQEVTTEENISNLIDSKVSSVRNPIELSVLRRAINQFRGGKIDTTTNEEVFKKIDEKTQNNITDVTSLLRRKKKDN